MADYICKTPCAVEFKYAVTDYKSFHLMVRRIPSIKNKVKKNLLGQINDVKHCFAIKSAVHMVTISLYFYYR